MLRLGKGLLDQTFAQLRSCGEGRRECVLYMTGPLEDPTLIDGVLHPTHRSARGGYQVDPAWLNAAFLELARRGREIRVQVHSHPREAFHSQTDDDFPVVGSAGFLSLVIPYFGCGAVRLSDTFLARLEAEGGWSRLRPEVELEVSDAA